MRSDIPADDDGDAVTLTACLGCQHCGPHYVTEPQAGAPADEKTDPHGRLRREGRTDGSGRTQTVDGIGTPWDVRHLARRWYLVPIAICRLPDADRLDDTPAICAGSQQWPVRNSSPVPSKSR